MNSAAALEALEQQLALTRRYAEAERTGKDRGNPAVTGEIPKILVGHLKRAQTYYVSADIAGMLYAALPTLPLSIPLSLADLPCREGFVWFARPVDGVPHPQSGLTFKYHGFGWEIENVRPKLAASNDHDPRVDRSSAALYVFGTTSGRSGVEFVVGSAWAFGLPIDDTGFTEASEESLRGYLADRMGLTENEIQTAGSWLYECDVMTRMVAYSFWHFVSQRCVIRERVRPDRASRRRFEGYIEWEEPPSVEVVKLRRPVPREPLTHDEDGRDYSVRWIVSGHWRKQWYPSLGEATDPAAHKPKWIEAYIKGPEDMPLKSATKLFAVTR